MCMMFNTNDLKTTRGNRMFRYLMDLVCKTGVAFSHDGSLYQLKLHILQAMNNTENNKHTVHFITSSHDVTRQNIGTKYPFSKVNQHNPLQDRFTIVGE